MKNAPRIGWLVTVSLLKPEPVSDENFEWQRSWSDLFAAHPLGRRAKLYSQSKWNDQKMNISQITDEDGYKQALKLSNGYLLITGDSSFEAYLTVPVQLVKASLLSISTLMLDLESLEQTNVLFPGDVSQVVFAGYDAWLECGVFVPGDKVTEHGEITNDLWLSPLFDKFHIKDQVWNILSGQAPRLSMNSASFLST